MDYSLLSVNIVKTTEKKIAIKGNCFKSFNVNFVFGRDFSLNK